MIEGNCNKQKVYVHAETVDLWLLLHLGWRSPVGWADEILVDVVSSREVEGYWFYWCWVSIPAGNKILMELAEWDLFYTVEAAYYNREKSRKQKELYKYARNYRVKKTGTLKRFWNFLAKKDQASAQVLLPARPENTRAGQESPALFR